MITREYQHPTGFLSIYQALLTSPEFQASVPALPPSPEFQASVSALPSRPEISGVCAGLASSPWNFRCVFRFCPSPGSFRCAVRFCPSPWNFRCVFRFCPLSLRERVGERGLQLNDRVFAQARYGCPDFTLVQTSARNQPWPGECRWRQTRRAPQRAYPPLHPVAGQRCPA